MKYGLVLCVAVLAIMRGATVEATIFYIAPSGSDAANGTSTGTPWKTFAHAIPLLGPGDTLTFMDGTYTRTVNGMMSFTCGAGGVVNGTAGNPITLRAQNERKAHVQSDGLFIALYFNQCSYWTVEGLRLSSADNPVNNNSDGSVVYAKNGDHLIIRRLIMSNNNRYFNGHALTFDANNSLIEENEIYSVHRHGIALSGDAHDNVLRRNYLNSRGYVDLVDGRYSQDTTRGDTGITCYPCHSTLFENNIAEGWWASYDIQATNNASNNIYLGNISLNSRYGALIASRDDNGNNLNGMPQNTQLTNFIAIGSSTVSLYLRSNKNTRCDHCMFLSATGGGVWADVNGTQIGDGLPTIFGSNVLIGQHSGNVTSITGQSAWGIDYLRVFSSPANFVPTQPNAGYTHLTLTNPNLGTCLVFIPAASSVHGAGLGGEDIGANVLYRYQDGTLTINPLWSPTTGAFPCGSIIAGINDIAGSSCFDVHQRLNVNFNGCTLPTAAAPLPAPYNLRLQ